MIEEHPLTFTQRLIYLLLYSVLFVRGVPLTDEIPNPRFRHIGGVTFSDDVAGDGIAITVSCGEMTETSFVLGHVVETERTAYVAMAEFFGEAMFGKRAANFKLTGRLLRFVPEKVISRLMVHMYLDYQLQVHGKKRI